MPVAGPVSNPLIDLGTNRSTEDDGQVGYYKTSLVNGITIEIAASNRSGFYQYTLPSGNNSVVVDVSHVLPSFRGLGWGQGYAGGGFNVYPDDHYEGYGVYNNGWNIGSLKHFLPLIGLTPVHSPKLVSLLLRLLRPEARFVEDLHWEWYHVVFIW